ncbi:MAG: ABC transporter substrate-binding protein [Actinomycetota bacterium]
MTRTRWIAILTALVIFAAACSDDDSGSGDGEPDAALASATEPASASGLASEPAEASGSASEPAEDEGMRTTYPLTFETCGVESTLDGPPESIVLYYDYGAPLLLWGLGDTIESFVTFQLDTGYPGLTEADYADLPITTEQPSREAIIDLSPDLILTASDFAWNEEAGFLSREDLNEAGIATWLPESLCAQDKSDPTPEEAERLENRGFDDVIAEFLELGVIVDRQAEAEALAAEMEGKMAEVEARVPDGEPVSVAIITGPADGSDATGVYTGGVNEDVLERIGGLNPFRSDDRGQFTTISVEELTITPLDVVLTDGVLDPGGDENFLGLFPTWPASEDGRIFHQDGLVSSGPGLPWAAERAFERLYPDVP